MERREEKEVIIQDYLDFKKFQSIVKGGGKMAALVSRGRAKYPASGHLLQDLFAAYFKVAPSLKEHGIAPSALLNRNLVAGVLQCEDYRRMHPATKLDAPLAAAAAYASGLKLLEEMENSPDIKDLIEKANEASALEEQLAQAEAAGQPGPEHPNAQSLAEALAQIQKEIQEKLADPLNCAGAAARSAAEAGKDVAQKTADTMRSWGITPAQWRMMPPEQFLDIVDLLLRSRELRQIADLAGHMRAILASKKVTRFDRGVDEICDVETGADPARLLPSEWALLADPELEDLFWAKFVEKALLQYRMRERQTLGRGPVVLLRDNSGSMKDRMSDGRTRAQHAVALCVALTECARLQKRQLAAVVFQGVGSVKEFRFDPEKLDIRALAEFAMLTPSGGTSYETALDAGLDLIKKAPYRRADMVLVTDGLCKVGDKFLQKFLKAKAAEEFAVYSLLVETKATDGVRAFSDAIINYTGVRASGRLFEYLLSPERGKEVFV